MIKFAWGGGIKNDARKPFRYIVDLVCIKFGAKRQVNYNINNAL